MTPSTSPAIITGMELPIVVEHFTLPRAPLRIAVVSETFPPEVNGVAMTLGRLVDGLVRRQHSVQLVRPRQGEGDSATSYGRFEEILAPGLPIPRYEGLRFGLPAGNALFRLWSHQRPDLVHVVTQGPLGWSALSVARKLKLPITAGFHTNFDRYSGHYGIGWLKRPVDVYLRRFHNRIDTTFVPTVGLLDELTGRGFRNLALLSRGVDAELFSPARRSDALRRAWGLGDDDLAVLHVGRLAPEKNLDLLLAAFAEIAAGHPQHPQARLILVGDGPARTELQKRHPQHIFVGQKTGIELAEHYASGDLFLFPSLTETFGNVTLEAMAGGLPVVAFDYAAAAETIRDGDTGFLARPGDAAGFVAAARNAATNLPRLREIGRRARERVLPVSWERIHDIFATALIRVVKRHDRRRHADFAVAPID